VTRGSLIKLIRVFAANAIKHDDQPFGRQLATICEQAAVTLRAKFGGRSVLLDVTKYSAKKAAQSPSNGISRSPTPDKVEIRVLSPEERWERELALWRELAADENPLYATNQYAVWQRIEAVGLKSTDFTRPILAARREKRPLVITSPNGEAIPIDNR
jgi:hypothetical protein